MARKRRVFSPTGIYHWIVRGIHKKHIFHSEEDFKYFKNLLYQYKIVSNLSIYHYCIMNNHAHLLIQAQDTLVLGVIGTTPIPVSSVVTSELEPTPSRVMR